MAVKAVMLNGGESEIDKNISTTCGRPSEVRFLRRVILV